MDTFQIFKNVLGLVWRYRTLWLFGRIMGLMINNMITFAGGSMVLGLAFGATLDSHY